MCFSATASFAAAALLLGIGTLTLKSALAAHRQADLPFAAIPMLFALQQLIKGVIWLTFSHQSLVGAYLMYVLVAFPIGSRPTGQHVEYVSPHFFAAVTMTLCLLSTAVVYLHFGVRRRGRRRSKDSGMSAHRSQGA